MIYTYTTTNGLTEIHLIDCGTQKKKQKNKKKTKKKQKKQKNKMGKHFLEQDR